VKGHVMELHFKATENHLPLTCAVMLSCFGHYNRSPSLLTCHSTQVKTPYLNPT